MKNLADHDSFVDGIPHDTFEQMRNDAPLHWTPPFAGNKGFWSLTRYADIMAAQKDTKTFSSAQGIRIEDQSREEYLAMVTEEEERSVQLFKDVIKSHPGTPWARRAQYELRLGFGHTFREGFRDPRYQSMRAQIKLPNL